jgi:hypothetical protein
MNVQGTGLYLVVTGPDHGYAMQSKLINPYQTLRYLALPGTKCAQNITTLPSGRIHTHQILGPTTTCRIRL